MVSLHILDRLELQEDVYFHILSQRDGHYETGQLGERNEKERRSWVNSLTFKSVDFYD